MSDREEENGARAPDVRAKPPIPEGDPLQHLQEELAKLPPDLRRRLFTEMKQSTDQPDGSHDDGSHGHFRPHIRKIKNFSGRSPVPGNEVDFATWRVFVQQYLNDPEIKNNELKSAILQSLSGPALSTIQHLILSPKSTAGDLFDLLESTYDKRTDGHELLAHLYEMIQGPKQTASEYCQELYIHLSEVIQMKGLHPADFDLYLNRQLMRGCRDDHLLERLALDPDRPIPFPDLIRLIRAEETRRQERDSRFGAAPKARSHMMDVASEQTSKLEKQVKELQQQMKSLMGKQSSTPPPKPTAEDRLREQVQALQAMVNELQQGKSSGTSKPAATSTQGNRRPFRGFCYKCGKDGHVMQRCTSEANPALVQEKLVAQAEAKRRHRQQNRPSPVN